MSILQAMKSKHKWSPEMLSRCPFTFDLINKEIPIPGVNRALVNGVHEAHATKQCNAIHFPRTIMLMKSATEERKEHPSETFLLVCNDAYSLTYLCQK